MKVLIISGEVWQDGTNGGNVLSNMFADSGFEFAQIYCNPGTPKNNLCKKYYQMTDGMVIKNVLKKDTVGRSFDIENIETDEKEQKIEQPNKSFYSFFHKYRFGLFYAAKDVLWNICDWKNNGLKAFIDSFNPDIIFAPCYGNSFMLKLTRFVAEYTQKKVISYISDDSYTLNQFNLSPYFWVNRLIVRSELRKTFPYYSLVYTMTDEQKKQCERDLHGNMKILRKSASFGKTETKVDVNTPIRIVYAGGIYLNRWKTLKMLADEIRIINVDEKLFQLDIYTSNETDKKMEESLNDGYNVFLHSAISQDELKEVYKNSDIALHVESFDLKNRLLVRMSFSTKIVDCLSSGCAVMAICDAKQGGYNYLKTEDAAFCVASKEEIRSTLHKIKENPKIVVDYSKKAAACCEYKHNKEAIRNTVISDFENVLKN